MDAKVFHLNANKCLLSDSINANCVYAESLNGAITTILHQMKYSYDNTMKLLFLIQIVQIIIMEWKWPMIQYKDYITVNGVLYAIEVVRLFINNY